ncbi:AraC family transcriptional regulator [Caldibacillus lycopersici]|uniref:AraC family transcriptional regulator n=1 Tax=Perspicuibacillus lycopersici TaxID=1325689 RepID=A0AAE3IV52_9BACI|nr:AraC family transcriptional regulator [Perspicuibacillus lycopersici]MCU9615106.1 AraC family transcriptional regulator [Perspicuibacillus lycopersici]
MRNSYLEIRKDNNEFPIACFFNSGDLNVLPHWHKEVEIVYVLKGTLNIGINDTILTMAAGEIRIINGGEVHYYLSSPDSERIVVMFDHSFFKDMRLINKEEHSLLQLLNGFEKSSLTWPESTVTRLQSLIREIYEEMIQKEKGYLYAIKSKMYELILWLYRTVYSDEKSNQYQSEAISNPKILIDNLNKIFSFIEEHYQQKITIEDISQYLGFNPQYFTRYFKKLTGQTFVTFLNDYRLNKAKWILLNDDLQMIEVASLAGFHSVKTFHHLFKEKFGTSPLKYKKSKYGNN